MVGKIFMDARRVLVVVAATALLALAGSAVASTAGTISASARPAAAVAAPASASPAVAARAVSSVDAAALSAVGQGATVESGSLASTIIAVIIKYAGVSLSFLKALVGRGWSAFLSWWNSLSSWVRWIITNVLSIPVSEIFNQLWHYFFG